MNFFWFALVHNAVLFTPIIYYLWYKSPIMQIINQNAHTNKEGVINISIPTNHVDTDVELVVVINPINKAEKNQLSKEEIEIVEDRWEEYLKNPDSAKSWDEVKNSINKKYGI